MLFESDYKFAARTSASLALVEPESDVQSNAMHMYGRDKI